MRTSVFAVLFLCLILLRLGELVLAESNRRWALARGGQEWDSNRYPWIVLVHILFYASLFLEWHFWSPGWNGLWRVWLLLLLAAQVLRWWAIFALGRCWNTRVIIMPGMNLVTAGPYRFVRHPNYVAVIIEFIAIPMLCSAYFTAVLLSLANAWILTCRIPREEEALRQGTGKALPPLPRFIPRFLRKSLP